MKEYSQQKIQMMSKVYDKAMQGKPITGSDKAYFNSQSPAYRSMAANHSNNKI